MRDLALDLTEGDLLLESSAARLTVSTEGENVSQRLYIRLGHWRGENVLDRNTGIPYAQTLGRKDAKTRLGRHLRRAAETCPGVATVDAFSIEVDAERHAVAAVEARTAEGYPVTLEAFDAGAI